MTPSLSNERVKTAEFYSRMHKPRHNHSYIADFKEKMRLQYDYTPKIPAIPSGADSPVRDSAVAGKE